MADETDQGEGETTYARETERLRSAARWITAGVAGFGAVIVAGMDLTRFGQTWDHSDAKAWLALASLVVGAGAFGWMIATTAAVFTSGWLSFEEISRQDFQDRLLAGPAPAGFGWLTSPRRALLAIHRARMIADRGDILADIDRAGSALYGEIGDSVADVYRYLHATLSAHRDALRRGRVDDDLQGQLATARAVSGRIVDFANYAQACVRFRRAKRCLAAGSTIAFAAVIVFAVTAYG